MVRNEPPTTGTDTNRATNETRLLAAAIDVFAESGYAKTGVAEIARRANLTTGAIYSRYSGKAELLVTALDTQLASQLEALFASGDTQAPTAVLGALGQHVLDREANSASALLLEAVVAARHEPELNALLQRLLVDERSRVGAVIDQAKAANLFDADLDTVAVLTFVQAIGLGFTVFHTLGTPMPDPEAWQVVIDRLIAAAMPPVLNQTHPQQPPHPRSNP